MTKERSAASLQKLPFTCASSLVYVLAMATADDHRTYSIRQLCREFGATARALRFYEDKGLLTPARKGQTRVYDARDRARLKLILRGRRIGFTLTEIQEMLDLYDRKDGNAHQMAIALRRHRAQIEALKQQREDLDAAIETAEEACAAMEARLTEQRPDLLPGAEEYASVLRDTPRQPRPSSVQAESLTPWPTRRPSAT